ncbi:hypothetical protein HanIR_Chr10g0461211 [Helianthus annuus]|nr:hypothetical protein HanIR_Chr10g0461211 [Helianthus annuus]
MSGEGSSFNLKKRKIQYQGKDRRVYSRVERLVDHPILDFEEDSEEREKLVKFVKTNLLEHRAIDWEWLQGMGVSDRVADLLGPRLRAAMDCQWPQHTELTLEFHCTFRHKEGTFAEKNAVSFSLGRNLYEMSIAEFGVALGFYTKREVLTDDFVNGLRGAYNHARPNCLGPEELARFWETIATTPFAGTKLISSVRDPIHRYILKVLATTIVARRSGENKANWLDLFALMCMVEKRNWNLASFFAWSCNRPRRGGNRAAMDLGPYITRLATNLGALTKYKLEQMRESFPTTYWSVRDLQLASILSYSDPPEWEFKQGAQVQPPAGTEAANTLQGAFPPRQQRPRQRHEIQAPQHPLRQACQP